MRNHVTVYASPLGTGTVEINGQDVSNVVAGVTVNTQVGEPTTVLLRTAATAVSFSGEAKLVISEPLARILTAAGWTAPDE